MGQDLLQFVNAGFNPLQELSQKTGKSVGTLRKEMEKGLISAQMVKEAFASATGPGGRFFGNMEKQSTTLTGLWSTLRDNFHMMMAELGGQLVPFIKDVVTALIGMTDSIAGAYRQLGDFFSVMFSNGPTAQDIAVGIAAAFGTIADVVMLVGTALQGVWTIAEGLGTFMGMVVGLVVDLVAGIPKMLAYALKGASYLVELYAKATGNKSLQIAAIGERARAEGFIGEGLFANTYAQAQLGIDRTIASGKKTGALFGMIGGSKEADAGSKVSMNSEILKALQGKVVNNNITTNVTVHAEGSMKDILTEQANSIFGNVIGVQLRAASV